MAKGVSATSLKSVANKRLLLLDVCKDPSGFIDNAEIKNALSSQGRLAHLALPQQAIIKVSLNAFKRAASQELERGFVEIEELRNAALKAIIKFSSKTTTTNKGTKADLKEMTAQLAEDLARATEDCDLLTDTFYASINAANTALKFATIEEAQESWRKSCRELFANLSMASRRVRENNKKL
jgi:hypothetical protein